MDEPQAIFFPLKPDETREFPEFTLRNDRGRSAWFLAYRQKGRLTVALTAKTG